jgi:hypothetical protein
MAADAAVGLSDMLSREGCKKVLKRVRKGFTPRVTIVVMFVFAELLVVLGLALQLYSLRGSIATLQVIRVRGSRARSAGGGGR